MSVYSLEPMEEEKKNPGGLAEQDTARGKEQGVEDGGQKEMSEKVDSSKAVAQEVKPEKKPERASERSYERILERVQRTVSSVSDDKASAAAVASDSRELSEMDADRRVERLTHIALEKGPEHAFKVAMEIKDLYTIDKLHDELIFTLYDELEKKGMV